MHSLFRELTSEEISFVAGGYYVPGWGWVVTGGGGLHGGGGGGGLSGGGYDTGVDYGSGGGEAPPPGAEYAEIALKAAELLSKVNWDQAEVDLRDITYALFGGYTLENGQREIIDTNQLYRFDAGKTTVYYSPASNQFYGDRDGDGKIDTGVLINSSSGIVSSDPDANGTGNIVLGNLYQ